MIGWGVLEVANKITDITRDVGWEIENKVMDCVDEMQDTFDLLTTDPMIEGKKRGCERAAREYKPILLELNNNYTRILNILKQENNDKQKQFDDLIEILQSLENENKILEQTVNEKVNVYRERGYNIPWIINGNGKTFGYGCTNLVRPTINYWVPTMILFNVWKELQLSKRNEAEIEGYMLAREEYVAKVNKLKISMENETKNLEGKLNDKVMLIKTTMEVIAIKKEANVELKLMGELL